MRHADKNLLAVSSTRLEICLLRTYLFVQIWLLPYCCIAAIRHLTLWIYITGLALVVETYLAAKKYVVRIQL